MPFSDKELTALAHVADKLAQINARIDVLQRNDSIAEQAVRAHSAIRDDEAIRARKRAEAEQEERYRQRRIKDHENGKFTATQQIFNDALSGFGRSVEPAPEGMSYTKYLRKCTADAAQYLPADSDYKKFDYTDPDSVSREILTKFADKVLNGVRRAVWDGDTVAKGQERKVVVKDPLTNQTQYVSYVGKDCFVKNMGRPGRRVVNFMARPDKAYDW
jgi:hypothetical protein